MLFLLQCTSAINITCWQHKKENFSFYLEIHDSSSDQARIKIIHSSFRLSCLFLSWSVQTAFFISLSLISLSITFFLVTDIPHCFPFTQSTENLFKLGVFFSCFLFALTMHHFPSFFRMLLPFSHWQSFVTCSVYNLLQTYYNHI